VKSLIVAEEEAEAGRKEARRVYGGLAAEGGLNVVDAIGERELLIAKCGGVFLKVMDAVLLAQRPDAEKKDTRHGEELDEAVLLLHGVPEKTYSSIWLRILLLCSHGGAGAGA